VLNTVMRVRGGCVSTRRAVLKISRVCTVGDAFYDVVDIFDANAGTWSTAKLSVARAGLGATSLPSQGLALFAGGGGALLRK
jgi:hypothetical protein